jgi:hypothetical protein
MIRTLISLDPDDKAWLDREARRERMPVARLVRRAIQRLRRDAEAKPTAFDDALRRTAGIGNFGDGLAAQRKLRREWNLRS